MNVLLSLKQLRGAVRSKARLLFTEANKMKIIIATIVITFWSAFILFGVIKKDKSCETNVTNMFCPKTLKVSEQEMIIYHHLAVTALVLCFMVSVHIIFMMLAHLELSMFMMMVTSIVMGLFAFTHFSSDTFLFNCLGFLVGAYGANLLILVHILITYWKNRITRRNNDSDEEINCELEHYRDPEPIEMRNEQPGLFYDINTRTHIYNFSRND